MKIVVTGGAGFIGANLCRTLIENPKVDEVVVLDDLSTGSRSNIAGLDIELIESTVLDQAALDHCFLRADSIIHLAARSSVPRSVDEPEPAHEANATGTINVLQAARRAGNVHVIVASSSSVYGGNPTLPKSEDLAPQPLNPYAASKLASESYTLAWQHSYGLPTLAFRFFNVFGPLQIPRHSYAAVIPAFVSAALSGNPLPVHGDGKQSRDFTYVGSVCEVLVAAAVGRVSSSEPMNLAFGTRTTLLEIIEIMERLLGKDLDIEFGQQRPGDMSHTQASTDRLRSSFPELHPVDLEIGLATTINWFQGRMNSQGHI